MTLPDFWNRAGVVELIQQAAQEAYLRGFVVGFCVCLIGALLYMRYHDS
jgi:hypothetical protein